MQTLASLKFSNDHSRSSLFFELYLKKFQTRRSLSMRIKKRLWLKIVFFFDLSRIRKKNEFDVRSLVQNGFVLRSINIADDVKVLWYTLYSWYESFSAKVTLWLYQLLILTRNNLSGVRGGVFFSPTSNSRAPIFSSLPCTLSRLPLDLRHVTVSRTRATYRSNLLPSLPLPWKHDINANFSFHSIKCTSYTQVDEK